MAEITEAVVTVTDAFEGAAVDRLARRIAEAAQAQPGRLVVDLRRCPLVDAAGLAVLLQAHRAMVRAGGRLTLRAPAERVRRLLTLARLDNVFEIEDGVPA
jgi:anti-anti-sigma factor